MNRNGFTRRGFLQGTTLAAAAASPQSGTPQRRGYTHRTQFDAQLLAESYDPLLVANHGRHLRISPNGDVRTALAWGGDKPRLRLYKNRELAEEYPLSGLPSAPVLTADHVWYSVGTVVYRGREQFPGIQGKLLDAATASNGATVLAFSAEDRLRLALLGTQGPKFVPVDEGVGRASLEFDFSGALHVAYEKRYGIEHRIFENGLLRQSERVAEAYGFHPVLLGHNGDVILAYLGESCRLPSVKPGSDGWERLGRGGYVAALIRHDGRWLRYRLADSRPISKALYPAGDADSARADIRMNGWSEIGSYSEGVSRQLINHMEEFGPPAVGVGGDGVVQVLWSDNERRWIYGARLLGDEFTPLHEIRGPLEQLTGPCLIPKNATGSQGVPLAMVTRSRVYLDRIALPASEVANGRRINFITPDELAHCRGLEFRVNQMQRRPENPMPSAAMAEYRATLMSRVRNRVPSVEDPNENNPAHRFKGFTSDPEYQGFEWLPVTSRDGITWERVPHPRTIVRGESLRVWIDPDDVPERRYKVNVQGRTFCGRTSGQYTSPNGIEWNDERDTLDFQDPFRSRPDPNPTGRILLDSWSGPEDECELHGGSVFREGDRWLLHYMKWSPDGHIYCALAASRDGLNFSRVGGGAATLPLGEAGTWDAGRVAFFQPPSRDGNLWKQYYSGCAWKHGLGGGGAAGWTTTTPILFRTISPQQTGVAEIPVGHWVHLQTRREAEEGEIATVPLRLTRAHSLKVDSEGDTLKVAIFDPTNGRELPGFGYAEFDPLATTGAATWHGHGLETLGARALQLRIRITGPRVKLFGLELV